jgi:hypothetical protein
LNILIEQAEAYRGWSGRYFASIHADKIYRTYDNMKFCKNMASNYPVLHKVVGIKQGLKPCGIRLSPNIQEVLDIAPHGELLLLKKYLFLAAG